MVVYVGWDPSKHYFNEQVDYTEALFVVVIMAMAATRPSSLSRRRRSDVSPLGRRDAGGVVGRRF